MSIPTIKPKTKGDEECIKREMDAIYGIIADHLDIFCSKLKVPIDKAKNYIEELFSNHDILNHCLARSIGVISEKFFLKLKTHEGFVAAPGTIMNSALLYVLIRNFDLKKVFEAGTAQGFCASFLLLAAIKNGGHVDTVDLLNDSEVGKSILYDYSPSLTVHRGVNSTTFLREKNNNRQYYDLYCHDSTHTFSHMMRELCEFKKCEKDLFFVFFDDQHSDDFWNRCIKTNLFNKSGYDVMFTDSTRQLGGFLCYRKKC